MGAIVNEMATPNGVPDQRSIVLQMLKNERIALADAQILFALMDPDSDAERSPAETNGKSRADSNAGTAAVQTSHGTFFGFDLSALAERLKEGLSGIESAVKETFQAVDIQTALDRALAGAQTATEGRIYPELDGTEHSLHVSIPWGDVVVRGVDESSEVRVSYRIAALSAQQRTADFHAEYTRVTTARNGSEISLLIAPPDEALHRRIKVDVAIDVPRTLAVRVRSDCGDFTAAGMRGGVEFSGGIADVLLQELRGVVGVRSRLGNIVAELTEGCPARLDTRCVTGSVECGVPVQHETRSTNELNGVAFGDGRDPIALLNLRCDSGDIRILPA